MKPPAAPRVSVDPRSRVPRATGMLLPAVKGRGRLEPESARGVAPAEQGGLMRARFVVGLVAALLALTHSSPAKAGPDLVPVPDVTGLPRAEAESTLSAQGFLPAIFEVAGKP